MSKIKTNQIVTIDCNELDRVVRETYKRPYNFQQQDGCKSRGKTYITIPSEGCDYKNDTVPEIVNGEEMGVSFAAWLARDPKQPLSGRSESYALPLWWERNFYPSVDMILDDLYSKGLINAGEYYIDIDW
jgi:hypothetical protein